MPSIKSLIILCSLCGIFEKFNQSINRSKQPIILIKLLFQKKIEMIISTLIHFIIYIKTQLKEHKMPKNNSIKVINSNYPLAHCACGWEKKVERIADAKHALIRHNKYCVIGQQANIIHSGTTQELKDYTN